MMILKIKHDAFAESPREWDNIGTFCMRHRKYRFGDKGAEDIDLDTFKGTWLPVYMYDHGGITINTSGFSCPWDSGQIGVIYCDDQKARKEYGWKRITKKRRAKIRRILDGEIKTLDQFLRGDVWSYSLEDEGGNEIDSCSGFYGGDPFTNGMADHLPEELSQYKIRHLEN